MRVPLHRTADEDIPHEDPDPEPSTALDVDYPTEKDLEWDDFHPPLKEGVEELHKYDGSNETYWKYVANKINDCRKRFAQHNPHIDNPRLSNPDRSAVLAVYNEALPVLEHTTKITSSRIYLEVRAKVECILDVRTAAPSDPVFLTKDAYLSPLEPHYAHPRLDYYKRDTTNGDDSYYLTGYDRLYAWRREGWPKVYPAKAVEREKRERARWKREGRRKMRKTGEEQRESLDWLDWGETVDANVGEMRR